MRPHHRLEDLILVKENKIPFLSGVGHLFFSFVSAKRSPVATRCFPVAALPIRGPLVVTTFFPSTGFGPSFFFPNLFNWALFC